MTNSDQLVTVEGENTSPGQVLCRFI